MNRINQQFLRKKTGIRSVYFTAGYPERNATSEIIISLEKYGADMIEIGVPFSDPVADGPVIQKSSHCALNNGMSVKLLMDQLQGIRDHVSLPLVLMGYLNPFLQYGIEKLCKQLDHLGIDGVIIPDLPPEEYEKNYLPLFRKYGLSNILLVTPQTTAERVRYLDRLSSGFLYLVSTASTTGGTGKFGTEQEAYFRRIAAMQTANPLMIGFGISDKKSLDITFRHAAGGIIGSAFVRALENGEGSLEENIKSFMASLF